MTECPVARNSRGRIPQLADISGWTLCFDSKENPGTDCTFAQ